MSIINEHTVTALMDGFGPPPLPSIPLNGKKWSSEQKAQAQAAIGYNRILCRRLRETIGDHELSKITMLCGWPTAELDKLDKFTSRCASIASNDGSPLWIRKATGRA
mgnify:FL=1